MSIGWKDEYRTLVREFVATHGEKIETQEPHYSWQEPDDVSQYGYGDYAASQHIKDKPCKWIVPEGAELYEREYSMFDGTDADNLIEHGINVTGCHCECGLYQNVILRWTGSITEMLHSILGIAGTHRPTITL